MAIASDGESQQHLGRQVALLTLFTAWGKVPIGFLLGLLGKESFMENELLQSIGRLYTEALRLQSMVQQLQEQSTAKDVTISQLQEQLRSIAKPTITAERLPPELVATVTNEGYVAPDGI